MKRILIAAALLFTANVAMCQLGFGIKGGLNSTKLKMKDVTETIKTDDGDMKVTMEEAASDLGYHVGVFARINALAVFVQPEIYYTNMSTHIRINPEGDITARNDADVKNHRIDIPVIVGTKLGPARLGLGPVASFNLKSDSKISSEARRYAGSGGFKNAKKSALFSLQLGAGLDLVNKLTLDVRYEFGLSKLSDEVVFGNQTFKTAQRVNSFIASIGWMF